MVAQHPFDEPTNVTAENGEVVLHGPDGVGLSMTPEAAEETGRRLLEGARQARSQRPQSEGPDGR